MNWKRSPMPLLRRETLETWRDPRACRKCGGPQIFDKLVAVEGSSEAGRGDV
jgi:hypothetical protein